MCQYSPVISACVWDVQAAAQFASDADWDPECARTRKNRDTASWIHQGRVDALDILQKTHTLLCFFFIYLNYVSEVNVHNHPIVVKIPHNPHKSEMASQNEPFRNILQSDDVTLEQAPPMTGNNLFFISLAPPLSELYTVQVYLLASSFKIQNSLLKLFSQE